MNNKKDSSQPDDKKVAKSTSNTHSQSDNKQSDKDTSHPPNKKQAEKVAESNATYTASIKKQPENHLSIPESEKQHFATKADLESVKNVITKEMDDNQADNRVMFEEFRHEITSAKLWVAATIPVSIGFFILLLKIFSKLLITRIE